MAYPKNPPEKPPCSDYQARIQAGWCYACNNRVVPGTPYCAKHAALMREQARQRYNYQRRYPNARSYQQP